MRLELADRTMAKNRVTTRELESWNRLFAEVGNKVYHVPTDRVVDFVAAECERAGGNLVKMAKVAYPGRGKKWTSKVDTVYEKWTFSLSRRFTVVVTLYLGLKSTQVGQVASE